LNRTAEISCIRAPFIEPAQEVLRKAAKCVVIESYASKLYGIVETHTRQAHFGRRVARLPRIGAASSRELRGSRKLCL